MIPLAERMRPKTLDQLTGQEHLVGPDSILRKALESGHLPSMILWGPPGVGKTTLAKILATLSNRPYFTLSAISAGVKDVREVISQAAAKRFFNSPSPILFIDEIHRFNKGQQDALLGAIENGTITLIGATTENPSFEINSALLSRVQVYILKSLESDALLGLAKRIVAEDELFKSKKVIFEETEQLINLSNGDARKLCNIMEIIGSQSIEQITITNEMVSELVQQHITRYDKAGEMHYDIISAFIKSIRGSDPNAALYWMAVMIEGGEEVRFIARRMIILAAEDIGLANPTALLIANAAQQAVEFVGWPESRIILSEAVIYLACSPKSNSAYLAIDAALAMVRNNPNLSVPLSLRNAPTQFMKNLDYGKGYQYSHDSKHHFIPQEFLPEEISGTTFYHPAQNPNEEKYQQVLAQLWKEKYDVNR